MSPHPDSGRRRWPLAVAVWMVPALLASFETWMFWRMASRPDPFWRAVAMQAPPWLVYVAATPVVFWLGGRLPLERGRLLRNVPPHALAALVCGAAYAAVATLAWSAFSNTMRPMPLQRMMLSWYLSALPLTTLSYFGILGVRAALVNLDEARRRERDAARLEMQLTEARLGALKMQLHPHFLFNTLNTITVLARDHDSAAVVRMMTLLSDLLRDVLRVDHAQLVPLEQELAFARRYLQIELVRFADRLRVSERVDDAVLGALVPVFVLQPLIENALRHGIAPRGAGGTVTIGARVEGEVLELWVEDDGVGLPPGWGGAADHGIGLANSAARLAALYGSAGALDVEPGAGGGTRASLRMPHRVQPELAAGVATDADRLVASGR